MLSFSFSPVHWFPEFTFNSSDWNHPLFPSFIIQSGIIECDVPLLLKQFSAKYVWSHMATQISIIWYHFPSCKLLYCVFSDPSVQSIILYIVSNKSFLIFYISCFHAYSVFVTREVSKLGTFSVDVESASCLSFQCFLCFVVALHFMGSAVPDNLGGGPSSPCLAGSSPLVTWNLLSPVPLLVSHSVWCTWHFSLVLVIWSIGWCGTRLSFPALQWEWQWSLPTVQSILAQSTSISSVPPNVASFTWFNSTHWIKHFKYSCNSFSSYSDDCPL